MQIPGNVRSYCTVYCVSYFLWTFHVLEVVKLVRLIIPRAIPTGSFTPVGPTRLVEGKMPQNSGGLRVLGDYGEACYSIV